MLSGAVLPALCGVVGGVLWLSASGAHPEAEAPGPSGLHFTRVEPGPVPGGVSSSPSASWADVDADGDDDLYVLNGYASLEEEPVPQKNVIYRNDGGGEFTPLPEHPLVRDVTFSGSATWADFDNDGDLDVFVANQRGADNHLFRNEDGSFVRVTEGPAVSDGGRSFSAVWVDVDRDGLLDLHVLNGRDGRSGEVDFLYRNEGDGVLARVEDVPFVQEALRSGGASWADFDSDGDPDLLLPVYSPADSNRLYRNDGDWTFTEIAAEAGLTPDPLPYSPPCSVAHWVDPDGDGDLDLFLGNTRGTIDFLYANDGTGRFERITAGRIGLDATYVSDATWADLDHDADLDLVIAVWGGASEVYLNDGTGALEPAPAGDLSDELGFASSVTAADADGDGDLDLYLTQWPINRDGGAPNRFYRNDGAAGHWIAVELEGTESNRSAVGATITVTARIGGKSRRQVRHVSSRTSWRATGSLTRHFGLADAETLERIEVAWPSGRTEVLDGPFPVDRTLEIVEGRGVVTPRP